MARRTLIIGLDGATFDLLDPWMAAGYLPTFARLVKGGVRARLRSTLPALTPPAWTSAATGRNPGKHNVFNFYRVAAGGTGRVLTTPGDIRAPLLWEIGALHDRRSCILHLPLTYPPRADAGVMISGIMTPRGAEDFVAPRELLPELRARVPGYRLEVDTGALGRGDTEGFVRDAFDLQRVQTEESLYLLEREQWDIFWVMFHTLDKMQHFYWRHMDPGHPQHPGKNPHATAIRDFYRALDRTVERLLERVPPQTAVVVLSDHGAAPLHTFFHVTNWLIERGYLRLHEEGGVRGSLARRGVDARRLVRGLRRAGLGWLPRLVPGAIKRQVPRRMGSFARIADRIDWQRTTVYCSSAPGSGLWINLRGREAQGTVEPGREYDELRDKLRQELLALTDPRSGQPVVEAVHFREEIYSGPYCDGAPDLLLETARTVCMVEGVGPGVLAPAGLLPEERTGNHARRGILLLYGSGLRSGVELPEADICDVAPTVLHLLDLPVDEAMEGRVLMEALTPEFAAANPPRYAAVPLPRDGGGFEYGAEDRERIAAMLEGLGYM